MSSPRTRAPARYTTLAAVVPTASRCWKPFAPSKRLPTAKSKQRISRNHGAAITSATSVTSRSCRRTTRTGRSHVHSIRSCRRWSNLRWVGRTAWLPRLCNTVDRITLELTGALRCAYTSARTHRVLGHAPEPTEGAPEHGLRAALAQTLCTHFFVASYYITAPYKVCARDHHPHTPSLCCRLLIVP